MLLVAANFVRIVALNNVQANVGIEADGLSAWVLAYTQMPGSTPVFIAGITGIRKGDSIILSQQLGQFINVSYVGCRCGDRMNSAGIHIGADMDFHAEIPLLALSGLMHVRVARFILVFGRTGRVNNRGIDHRALRD